MRADRVEGSLEIGTLVEIPVNWPGFTQYVPGLIASRMKECITPHGEYQKGYDVLREVDNKVVWHWAFNITF
jgi:hypothetical protein